jgi:hypothetical protein
VCLDALDKALLILGLHVCQAALTDIKCEGSLTDMTNLLLRCGVLAGPIFVTIFLVEGGRRPDYDPLAHPVSSLALGDAGWIQTVNFLLAGVLTVAFAIGAHRALQQGTLRTWGALLIGIWGAGLIGAGTFRTDPVGGYPPDAPVIPEHASVAGVLHDVLSLPGFAALAAACFVFARWFLRRGHRGWMLYSGATGVAFIACFLLALAGFVQIEPLSTVAGLMQRMAVTLGWAWITALAIHLHRNAAPTTGRGDPTGVPIPA